MFLDQNCLLFHVITAVSSNIDDMVFKKLFKDRIDVYCIVDTSHANYDRNTTHSHMYSNLLMQPPLLISNKVQCDFQDHREGLWPSISVDRWGGLSSTTTVYVDQYFQANYRRYSYILHQLYAAILFIGTYSRMQRWSTVCICHIAVATSSFSYQ